MKKDKQIANISEDSDQHRSKIKCHILRSLILTLYHTFLTFSDLQGEVFGKQCVKRRNCWSPAFSSFPTFSTLHSTNFNF